MAEEKLTWREAQAGQRAREVESSFGMDINEWDVPDPVATARAAAAAGHHTLQLDMPVAWVQGWIGVGNTSTRYRSARLGDVIGAVEAEGWRLEHVSTSYVEQGSSATKRMLANAGSTLVANHGVLVGLYVFRRTD